MRPLITLLLSAMFTLTASAQHGKQIFIPEDLRKMDLNSDTSQWSWRRSVETPDLIFLWERGFGDNWQNPPQLEGHPMSFDLGNLELRVEHFYRFFRDTLKFSLPGSKADKYKMMVMINYSLDGTAYGGTYDNFIGALWVAPNRIQDRKLNALAHELGHSFQLQVAADSISDTWGGSGFFEMTSQWMLWQVNPDWVTDENYHYQAFRNLTHKAFLHITNIYHSPYLIEWWAEKHGKTFIGDLYRNGFSGEDPVMTYKKLTHMNQQQFCDETIEGYQHLVNFDFTHAYKETRPWACTLDTPIDTVKGGWLRPHKGLEPEQYGFNAYKLTPKGKKVNVEVKPVGKTGKQLRAALVAVTKDGKSIYGPVNKGGKLSMTLPQEPLKTLYLVVMGAPNEHVYNCGPNDDSGMATFPYEFKVK